jgi:predicted RNA-binding Zn-ribbon protein involved in translation (DUF1610 family)
MLTATAGSCSVTTFTLFAMTKAPTQFACPQCGEYAARVLDSRMDPDMTYRRRRRECIGCGQRYSSYEIVAVDPEQGLAFEPPSAGAYSQSEKKRLLRAVRILETAARSA